MAYKINEDLYIGNTNKQLKDLPVPVHDTYNTSSTDTYSCNYLNGIVESGSNGNGTWIKFADGTMICRFTQIINVAVNNAWGSLYSGKFSVHDYPQEFIDIPETSITLVANNTADGGNYAGFIGNNGGTYDIRPTNKNIGEFVILRATISNDAHYKVQVIAIGRWK